MANAALDQMRDALMDLETIRDELREALDNTPENFQNTDRYIASENRAEGFDQAAADLDSAISSLSDWL